MILRRLTQHVKDQNWFAVGLDFFIVVAGILIAFQITNWSEARAERVRSDQIKTRIVAEFIEIESELVRHVRDVSEWINIANDLGDDILTGNIEPDTENLPRRLKSIAWRPASGGSNTISELINQGDMDILNSPRLVELLLRFDSLSKRHVTSNVSAKTDLEYDYRTLQKISFLSSIPVNERPVEFSRTLEQLIAAPDFYLSSKHLSEALANDLLWHRELLKRACTVLQALKERCEASTDLLDEVNP